MLHGCCQLVSWDVWLSSITSGTLAHSCRKQIGSLWGLLTKKLEEGEDYNKSSWPLWAGLHTCYNGNYKESQYREVEQISKSCLSSDCTLQPEYMKQESLVIVDQHATVNTFSGLVHTARHTMGISFIRRF